MKKFKISLLLLLFAGSLSAQWEWQMPKPTGAALFDIGSFGLDAVFAVGLKGTIIKTTDGGNSFTQIESGTVAPLTSIYCIDENVGWIGSDSGLVLRTTNAGENWVKVREPRGWQKSSFFALDQNTAWLSTDYGELLKTTDGGQNWEAMETGIGKGFRIIRFMDAETGFALINESTPEHESFKDTVIVKTQDGGLHWDTLDLAFHKNIHFIETYPDDYIWISTYSYMLRSADRGQTWDTVQVSENSYSFPMDIAFRSASSFWLLTVFNSGDLLTYNIFYTADGGNTWENQYENFVDIWPGSGKCYNRIEKLYSGFGSCWAVGSPGTIMSYNNSESDWQMHSENAGGPIYDLFFFDEQYGYAIGHNSTLLTTRDGGQSWETANDLPGVYGYTVYFTTKEHGFVGIADDGLFATNDGGKSWKKVIGKKGFFTGIVFTDLEHGWALHRGGELYHTTDAGETWDLLTSLPPETWMDLNFVNLQTGFAAGKNGIMKTTDGGTTWTEVFNPGTFVNDLFFINEQTGWGSGDKGLVCKTTDGGDSWNVIDTIMNGMLYDIHFMSEKTGYLVNDGYGVFRSDDGAESWTFEPVFGLPMSYNSPGYWNALTTNGNDIWASYGCQILHKTDETVGIIPAKKIAEDDLTVYPNPVSQQLFIESTTKLTEITILNLNGQLLLNKKHLNTGSLSVNVDFLKPGLYFLKTKSEKRVAVSRFVKIE